MRLLSLSFAGLVLLGGLGGCLGSGDGDLWAVGNDPSLPGVEVRANATADGADWVVRAEAANLGSRTYRVDAGCGSPFQLEARADRGEEYQEVQCLAYTPPVPFRPGERVDREWQVPADDLGWAGAVHFTVVFSDAEGVGEVRVVLS